MRAPAALAAIPLLTGCVVSLALWPALPPHVASAGLAGAVLALLSAIVCVGHRDAPAACVAISCGFFCTGLTLGVLEAGRAYASPLSEWFSQHPLAEPVVIEGTLREDAAVTSLGVSVVMDVRTIAREPVRGGVRLSVTGSLSHSFAATWRGGRRVRLPALLREASVYKDPAIPDDRDALARRGISLVGSVKSAALVEVVRNGSRFDEAAAAARAWARRRLTTAIGAVSERSAAIAAAILIGDRSRLPQEDERRLQLAGTYHVIAISGGNIAIVTALLLLLGRLLLMPARITAALSIVALFFYAKVTGPAPSVERAVTAAVIFLAARLIDHRGPPLNALAVAALLAAAVSPLSVLDPGFLLSFGATLGILVGVPRLTQRRRRDPAPRVVRVLGALLAAGKAIVLATICAELVLLPISAVVFGRVTFAGLLLNLVAIPLMSVVQISGALVLAGAPPSAILQGWLIQATHLAAAGLVESARLVDVAPWLVARVTSPGVAIVAVYYAGVGSLLVTRVRLYAAAAVTASTALMLAGPPALSRDAVAPSRYPLRVVVLDVGQGDATVVSIAGGRTLLVDAGGIPAYGPPQEAGGAAGFDIGDRIVLRALNALDVSYLGTLVLTHGDPDHILGAPAILSAMRVESVWEGVPVPPHPGLRALKTFAASRGITWRTVQAGDREQFGEIEVRVLHPPPPEWERQRIRNEDSIVLEVRLGHVSIILAGDVGKEGERVILSRLEPGRLAILKAGHHGSATSSTPEFLQALQPAAVIFSAGRDNRFGHPHPAVVERFRQMGSAIFRTDHDGAVFVETDGETLQMRGWTGRSVLMRQAPQRPTAHGTRSPAHTKNTK